MEVLLDEIGRRPGGAGDRGGVGSVAWAQERDGYALAAGLALGLVTLGSGRSALGLADLRIVERLRCAGALCSGLLSVLQCWISWARPGVGLASSGPHVDRIRAKIIVLDNSDVPPGKTGRLHSRYYMAGGSSWGLGGQDGRVGARSAEAARRRRQAASRGFSDSSSEAMSGGDPPWPSLGIGGVGRTSGEEVSGASQVRHNLCSWSSPSVQSRLRIPCSLDVITTPMPAPSAVLYSGSSQDHRCGAREATCATAVPCCPCCICATQVVLEGDEPNPAVTAPGATLALALMFLKTNDAAVANVFAVPSTAYALDLMRPDQVHANAKRLSPYKPHVVVVANRVQGSEAAASAAYSCFAARQACALHALAI